MNWTRVVAVGTLIVSSVGGCAQNTAPAPGPIAANPATLRSVSANRVAPNSGSSKIQHVVIIIQENRTVNNLFNGFNDAGTVKTAKNSLGQTVQLRPISLTAPYDISHAHSAFLTEWDNGKMDGFDLVHSTCKTKVSKCPPPDVRAYGYVPQREVAPYFVMARRYTFARNMFETNQGPSFPAHQYLLSGTSTISDSSTLRASENPLTPLKKLTGGCDSPSGSLVKLIDLQGNENQSIYPCFDRNSLIALIDAKSLTWHYYQNHLGAGLWEAPDAIKAVHDSSEFAKDVVAPPSQVLNDIDAGTFANVVWITPTWGASDHAGSNRGLGPSWVASVVNKIGESQYWNNTAIFVTWDDWGGWYDPVPPLLYNSYELGLRVPLLVISPYAKPHYISRKQHEFASILKFTEEVFGLGSLGTTDTRADDLRDCFDFSRGPRQFVPITAPHDAGYFLRQPISDLVPDDDF